MPETSGVTPRNRVKRKKEGRRKYGQLEIKDIDVTGGINSKLPAQHKLVSYNVQFSSLSRCFPSGVCMVLYHAFLDELLPLPSVMFSRILHRLSPSITSDGCVALYSSASASRRSIST